jgi:hypothetical protein
VSDDLDALTGGDTRGLLDHSRFGAQEVHAISVACGAAPQRQHEVDAGDSFGHRRLEETTRPDDGLAVGVDE